ncbi:tetratricopeptide repeat protein [Phosphitispora fastidiosa]|uniref:tetratricopeptide repeat protein n=1 Tax=Phosphitispora fastidiosa TaxID=2837202 RepID=UPI001E648B89|nr:tetratricopeptide repeat protein [Phosphitispora fastidiosa]MBU7005133.1 tetratricopeptide (TPR) repeat protein [Phosphitispora fastidiosa]
MSRIFCSMMFLIVFTVSVQTNVPDAGDLARLFGSLYSQRQVDLAASDADEEKTVQSGWVYYKMGSLDKAKNVMEGVLENDHNISALYCLGMIGLDTRDFESAAESLEAVLELSPQHLPSLINLGKAYYFSGRYHLAEQCFENALQLEPGNSDALFWIDKTCSGAGI